MTDGNRKRLRNCSALLGARGRRWDRGLLLVLIAGAVGAASAQTTSKWLDAVDGDWDDPTKWSTTAFPNNGSPTPADTYDAVIDATGGPYTVDLHTAVTLDGLLLNSADATLALDRFGDLSVLGPVELQAGTFAVLGGRISGGTISSTGGSMEVGGADVESSTFDGVTLDTDLILKDRARLHIENGLVLEAGRRIRFTAERNLVTMTFVGNQVLSGEGEIVFGPPASMDYNRIYLEPASTLTIGPNITIRTAGANGRLGSSTIGNGIINQGLISGEVDDERAMRIDGPTFDNQGIVQAINGGRVILDGDWTNNGILRVDGGTIDLDSEFTNADIGTIDFVSGHIRITGTLRNAGALTVDSSNFPVELAGSATIVGGTIASADGQPLLVRSGKLDGVVLDANVEVAAPDYGGARLDVANGLTLNNRTISLSHPKNNALAFAGTQTLGGQGVVRCMGSSNSILSPNGTLTIGPDIVIENPGGGYLYVGDQNAGLINHGLIKTGAPRRVQITGKDWVNHGTFEVEPGGALELGGTVKTADLGTIVNHGGLVSIWGTIDNAGQILDLQSKFGPFRFAGTIRGGTLAGTPPLELLQNDGGGYLDGVFLDVDTLLTAANTLWIKNGLTLNNRKIKVTCGADLVFDGQSLGGTGEVIVNSKPASIGYTTTLGGSGLVIGPDITIRTGYDAGGSFDVEISGDGLVNQGTIVVDKGAVTLGGSGWSNQGLIEHSGGSLHFGGSYTTAAIGNLVHTGGEVVLEGTMDNTGDTLLLDASTGSWHLCPGKIVGGRIETTDGAELIAGRRGDNRQAQLEGVTLAGDMRLDDCELHIENGLAFDGGTIRIAGPDYSEIHFPDVQTISGQGEIVFDAKGDKSWIRLFTGSDLTIGEGVMVRTGTGGGQVGTSTLPLTNQGTISAQTPGQEIRVVGTFANSGTLQASGGMLKITSPDWTNQGTIKLYNATISLEPALSLTNGTSGRIEGIGTLDGSETTFINHGSVDPGIFYLYPSLYQPGRLTFDGEYHQAEGGVLSIDIGRWLGADRVDSVGVTGGAWLGGRLEVQVLPEARVSYGDTLEFLTAASVTGRFDEQILPTWPDGEPMFRVWYGADRVALVCVPEPGGLALVAVGLGLLLGYVGLRRSRP